MLGFDVNFREKKKMEKLTIPADPNNLRRAEQAFSC